MSNKQYITDRTGKWVGSVTNESNGKKTILDAKGVLLGRVHDGKTLDNKGAFFGRGDQSQRLFK